MSRLLWAAVLTGALFAVLAVLVATDWHPLLAADRSASRHATGYTAGHADYRHVMRWCTTQLAPARFRYAALLVLLGALLLRRWRLALFTAIAAGGSFLTTPVKDAIGRPRPTGPLGHFVGLSFPSGHAVGAALGGAVLLVAALTLLPRPWHAPAVVVVVAAFLLTGWTRIALGAHFPSDIVGGLLYGASWSAFALAAVQPGREER